MNEVGRVADSTGNWVDTFAPPFCSPLPAACARRPADRRMAPAHAMLVVRRARCRRGGTPLPQSLACASVLRRRLRDARRGLHLERHHRPQARRAGRTHALAPDPLRTGERARGGDLSRLAGIGRPGGARAVQPLHHHARHCVARDRCALSARQARHVVAAGRARPRLLVGRADGLGRGVRSDRCAGAAPLCRLDRLGDRLRHDLCASGPRGRCADRGQIDRAPVRRADPAGTDLLLFTRRGADRTVRRGGRHRARCS